ncbi:MAG: VTT domain-containing protein [Phycisphaerales bacterium]|nr:VTT domain-containing protein [Phycisphaerales bacterium]
MSDLNDVNQPKHSDDTRAVEAATEERSVRVVLSTVLGISFVVFPVFLGFWLLANIKGIGASLLMLPGPQMIEIPLLGLLVYIVGFALTSGLGILPTYAQSIFGGWIFGFSLGVPAALLGFTGGALLGWMICRVVSSDAVTRRIDRNPRWRVIRRAFVDESPMRTLGLVTLVRFPPNSPFALTNLALAVSGVRILPYAIGTFVGMAPRTIVACVLAASAAETGAVDIQTFIKDKGTWPLVIGVVVMILALAILSKIGNAAIARAFPGVETS